MVVTGEQTKQACQIGGVAKKRPIRRRREVVQKREGRQRKKEAKKTMGKNGVGEWGERDGWEGIGEKKGDGAVNSP